MSTTDPERPEGPRRNRLAAETSPYLLQHAGNPVDWYPWGDEAFGRARLLDRPVFLSVGYAACHWCHVMERESFEDPLTAADLNRDFVSIKVDREERPDVDALYMAAVQAMTGQGGWPMSVFLTPDGRPFYGGTYFPPQPAGHLPAFRQVLAAVRSAWTSRREEVEASATQVAEAVAAQNRPAPAPAGEPDGESSPAPRSGLVGPDGLALELPPPPAATLAGRDRWPDVLERARDRLLARFDPRTGGWGGPPLFPQPQAVEFLLREAEATGSAPAREAATRHLHAMARGGIHDVLGGGFARYATDARWLVPHFEKMLYDNAQIARACLHAWQLTDDEELRTVAESTLAFLLRDLANPEGAFIASLDADTQGVEGATYTWSADEVERLLEPLGEPATRLFAAAYDVTSAGNWDGRIILHPVADEAALAALAAQLGRPAGEVPDLLAAARARLLEARRERPQPARDEKIVTAWNGLALAALAEAAAGLGRADFAAAAVRCAEFLTTALVDADGRLRRTWRAGRLGPRATLEDHAALADGLLALYALTFDERWFREARRLAREIRRSFADPVGGWFDTPEDGERLIVRPKGIQDGATPSGGALAAAVLLRLAALTGDADEQLAAETAVGLVAGHAERYPSAFAAWLVAIDLAARPITEVAVVGRSDDPATDALVGVVRAGFRPRLVVAAAPGGEPTGAIPLLEGRTERDGRPAAYVCREFACRAPVSSREELRAELALQSGSTARPSR